MEATEQSIIAFLKEKAVETWEDYSGPYLLSLAANDLKIKGVDYKEVLKEEKLLAFVKRTNNVNGYRFVAHPWQKAKVGIVPTDKEFNFLDDRPEGSAARLGRIDIQRIQIMLDAS